MNLVTNNYITTSLQFYFYDTVNFVIKKIYFMLILLVCVLASSVSRNAADS